MTEFLRYYYSNSSTHCNNSLEINYWAIGAFSVLFVSILCQLSQFIEARTPNTQSTIYLYFYVAAKNTYVLLALLSTDYILKLSL